MEDPGGGGFGTVDTGEAVETELPCALAEPASVTTSTSERRIPLTHKIKMRRERRDSLLSAFTTVQPLDQMPRWHILRSTKYFTYLSVDCQQSIMRNPSDFARRVSSKELINFVAKKTKSPDTVVTWGTSWIP